MTHPPKVPADDDDAPPSQTTAWAEDRTDWAEDRTLLANERTFAGWTRTGLATLALALGLSAVFRQTEPTYLAKAVAMVFVALAVGVFIGAFLEARCVVRRMNAHAVAPVSALRLAVMTAALVIAAVMVGGLLWLL